MRKSDKKKNFLKVNLLAEQRYLQSKGIVTESFHEADGTPIGVNEKHMPITEYGQSKQFDLRDEQNMDSLISMIVSYLGKEKTNDASIANDNKVIVYTELLRKLMLMSPPSTLNNGENGSEIYTNNPEAMRNYLNKFKVGGDFKFIDSKNTPYDNVAEINDMGLAEEYMSEAVGSSLEKDYFMYEDEFYRPGKLLLEPKINDDSLEVKFGLEIKKFSVEKGDYWAPIGGQLIYYLKGKQTGNYADDKNLEDILIFVDSRYQKKVDAKNFKMIYHDGAPLIDGIRFYVNTEITKIWR